MTGIGFAVALAVGFVAVAAMLPGGVDAAVVGLVGLLVLGFGTLSNKRGTVTWGGMILFLGVLVAGYNGLDAGLLLVATIGTVAAWDAGTYVVELVAQLDEDAETGRATVVHVSATLVATTVIAGLAYLPYLLTSGDFPVLPAVLLVLGAIMVAIAIEPRDVR